jgi:hypothetical protein
MPIQEKTSALSPWMILNRMLRRFPHDHGVMLGGPERFVKGTLSAQKALVFHVRNISLNDQAH